MPCLNRPQVKAKTQGQFIRAIRNYAQNASLTNRYMLRQGFLYYEIKPRQANPAFGDIIRNSKLISYI